MADITMTATRTPDVDAQDAERLNSPIVDDDLLEECAASEPDVALRVCYLNDVPHAAETYVRSGSELLYYDKSDVWTRRGSVHE